MSAPSQALTLRRWVSLDEAPFVEPVFVFDDDPLPADLTNVSVVLNTAGGARARELLAQGAECVLLGEAALLDGDLIAVLASELGPERIGVWVPARRREISWTLDRYSNADFKCVTPSYIRPSWEVLTSDSSPSGTDVDWWVGEMLQRGASRVLVGIDIENDIDLDLCAGMVELCGAKLWLTPLTNLEMDMRPWIEFGQASNLVIPAAPYYDEAVILALQQMRDVAIETTA
jgi:hypothetical protein